MTKTVQIEGMSCMHCVKAVEKALTALPGVEQADVNLEAKQAVVTYSGDLTDAAIKAAVEDAGYEVTEIK